ncbi:MAG: tRNA 4-thiouridine(8) synthase ThiI [Clostridiales bacterium]|nr:tRNA 4-thiouridine(8) synthase ThiI [Clostridiales bacterium]
MKEIILLKSGELALKGLNRRNFEDLLMKNMRRRLKDLGSFKVTTAQSTFTVEPLEEGLDLDLAFERLSRVFGISALSRAAAVAKDINAIFEATGPYLADSLKAASTFKVEAKRADKNFPLKSPEICSQLGSKILQDFPHLKVDVRQPDLTINVEVRDKYAFIRGNQTKGAGGLPVGSSGRAALLISGGIDSPVAAWMMAKRGLELVAVHFASPPYTGPQAEAKVHDLLKKVAAYSGRIALFTIPFTKIQEEISKNCPQELFTVIMRRFMMKIAVEIAEKEDCKALITGESLAQVASQTIQALACTDDASTLPVFRPLIGMDKEDVIKISRKIETFDISIRPYEDCCTIFTPKRPRTRPVLKFVKAAESVLDIPALVVEALEGAQLMIIR